jgi:two-component sensor histidine kinase
LARIQNQASKKEAQEKAKLFKYTAIVSIVFGMLLIIAIVFSIQFNLAKKRISQQARDLEDKNIELDKVISEKEFLFKELHHRVKNNIQLIISFMKLQYKFSSGIPLGEFIKEIESKMHAMALVHEKLYKEGTKEQIELKSYIQDVVDYMQGAISNHQFLPEITVKGDEVNIPIDKAISIGLIINEAITNSMKHGFNHPHKDVLLDVVLTRTNGSLELVVKDNGSGFPSGFDPEKSKSLGTKAIVLLSQQIMANVSWQNNPGAQWKLLIPLS